MDKAEFYEAAMQPDFPDSMNFELKTENPESTFSMEGYEGIAQQIRNFIMARTYANGMPNEMRIQVDLAFKIDGVWTRRVVQLDQTGLPWFSLDKDSGMNTVDGEARLRGLDV